MKGGRRKRGQNQEGSSLPEDIICWVLTLLKAWKLPEGKEDISKDMVKLTSNHMLED